jgi:ribonuclease HI
VKGFNNSRHYSFKTEAQAREYVVKHAFPSLNPSEIAFFGERQEASDPPPTIAEMGGWDDNFVRIRYSIPTETQLIYTDGACPSNGQIARRAGYGVYFGPSSPLNISARLPGPQQTNQRAELFAVLKALETLHTTRSRTGTRSVVIFTDNMYVVNGLTNWAANWERRGWKTASGGEVVSRDLFQRAVDMLHVLLRGEGEKIVVDIKHIPAHSGIVGNEEADQLAVRGAWMEEVVDEGGWETDYDDEELDQIIREDMENEARTGVRMEG